MNNFFIHYRPLPPGLKRFVLLTLTAVTAIIVVLGFWGPSLHNQYGPGRRQPVRELSGWLLDGPGGAQLAVPQPGQTNQGTSFNRVLLAGPGKTIPPPAVMDHVGEWVKVRGSLFSRGALDVMNTRKATPTRPPSGTPEANASGSSEGEFTLLGEIMDSKCFSGVMKPGSGKTHMGCAIRCISGGVPAVFHVRRNSGATLDFVLIDDQNRTVNERVLPLVAQPLELKGEVIRFDNLLALRANPETYRSLEQSN